MIGDNVIGDNLIGDYVIGDNVIGDNLIDDNLIGDYVIVGAVLPCVPSCSALFDWWHLLPNHQIFHGYLLAPLQC